jgi:ferredoxin-NADP reductase
MFSQLFERFLALFRSREPLLALPGMSDSSYRGTETGPIERMVLHQQLEYWLGVIAPGQSLFESRARVVDIQCRTPGARTIVLRPNWRFRGHEAGQFITISPSIDGKRCSRSYSISSAPGSARMARRGGSETFEITVGRVPGGRVSNWVHDHLRVGDVVPISQASGEFGRELGNPGGPALLVAGGTGVTPMRALLEDLEQGGRLNDAHLVHFAPTRERAIFAAEFEALAERADGFNYHLVETRRGGQRLSSEALAALVPDYAKRASFACGPGTLVSALQAIAGSEPEMTFHAEVFDVAALPPLEKGVAASPANVTLRKSRRTFEANASSSLLEQIEAQGLRPAAGCRMGMCKTCTCTKLAGVTMNLRTGEVSSGERDSIQICSSIALTAVELDL